MRRWRFAHNLSIKTLELSAKSAWELSVHSFFFFANLLKFSSGQSLINVVKSFHCLRNI